jgi:hypothetical protein
MLYKRKSFTVPASAGTADTCAQVGHCGPDARGRCLRCSEKMTPPAAAVDALTYAPTEGGC